MLDSRLKSVTFTVILSVVLTGCHFHHADWDKFKTEYSAGLYEQASKGILPEKPPEPDETLYDTLGSEAFLIGVQSGQAALVAKDFEHSTKLFDVSEDILSNDRYTSYSPKYYDKIMLNTYKGLGFWAKGDIDTAGTEFRLMSTRQMEAAKENITAIEDAKRKALEESPESFSNAQEALSEQYHEFDDFKPYTDFTNPFSSYLFGLYDAIADSSPSAVENAILELKRVTTMAPENKYVKEDLKMADKIAERQHILPTVWVIYEEGLFPEIGIQKIIIPFVTKSGVKLVNMSLPKFEAQEHSYTPLVLKTQKKSYTTQQLVDMERVMKTEFKARYPMEVAKAVVYVAANLVAQELAAQYVNKLASKHGGLVGKLGKSKVAGSLAAGAIASVTNPVETRTWTSLPKEIQIARFEMPTDRKVTIMTVEEKPLAEVTIDEEIDYALIYIRSPKTTAEPGVFVFNMQPRSTK